jgi:exopolysaccharide biosynthesis polyprenyl glycosylphosphotransferase
MDAVAVAIAVAVAYFGRFGWRHVDVKGVPYVLVGGGFGIAWLVALRLMRGYDSKVIGYGADEYRRVAAAGIRLTGLLAIVFYLADAPVARGFVALAFPVGTLGLLIERYAARKWLHRRRAKEPGWSHRVLVVGSDQHVADLVWQLRREPYAGYELVGVCLHEDSATTGIGEVPVVGSLTTIAEAIERVGADTVAVTASADFTATELRRLGWRLQDTGVDLVVAPALIDIAGPRIHTRPVAGLPLIHVEEPELSGPRKVAKSVTDRMLALVALLIALPLMLVIALAIRIDTRGRVIFRQTRVGMGGREFTMYKFRSMVVTAEAQLADLADRNETDGVLFKIRRDPRVTRVGRIIRKWSVDELPQLINVLKGDMSLVGPRPPLPAEVAAYEDDAVRRLLVPPGITGLWQVSGRANLSWADSVRLDLYYVENWSLATDLVIIWKTVGAVLRKRGAY